MKDVWVSTGSNKATVTFPHLTIWMSYDTPIAFMSPKTGIVCRQNDWGATTGKHLNAAEPDKRRRIGGAEFERQLSEVLKSFGLSN